MYFNQAPQKSQTNKSVNTEKQQPVILKTTSKEVLLIELVYCHLYKEKYSPV